MEMSGERKSWDSRVGTIWRLLLWFMKFLFLRSRSYGEECVVNVSIWVE